MDPRTPVRPPKFRYRRSDRNSPPEPSLRVRAPASPPNEPSNTPTAPSATVRGRRSRGRPPAARQNAKDAGRLPISARCRLPTVFERVSWSGMLSTYTEVVLATRGRDRPLGPAAAELLRVRGDHLAVVGRARARQVPGARHSRPTITAMTTHSTQPARVSPPPLTVVWPPAALVVTLPCSSDSPPQ